MYDCCRVLETTGFVSSETARVTAGYNPETTLAHIQELDSWAGDLRSSALLVSGRREVGANQFLIPLTKSIGEIAKQGSSLGQSARLITVPEGNPPQRRVRGVSEAR